MRRPGVEPLKRANRRRGGMTLYFKKKRYDWHTIQSHPVGNPLNVVQDSVRTLRAPPHCICRFPKNRIEGGVVITSLRTAENSTITRGMF